MKPAPFRYRAARSLDEVLDLLAEHGTDASLLAGGQSLIASLNFRCLQPAVLIDLNTVRGLDGLAYLPPSEQAQGELRIGAMTRQSTLEFDPLIEERLPLMHHAVPFIAHSAIRNRGTIGGSLCYADPAGEQPALSLALNARFKAASRGGERWIKADDFFLDTFRIALRPEEALVEIAIPEPAENTGWGFHEVARRHGDRVMMGVAAMVTVDETGICQTARLAYQNAAPTPALARRAADVLVGNRPSAELIAAAAQAAASELDPPDDVHATRAFRQHLAVELTRQALQDAFTRAAARQPA